MPGMVRILKQKKLLIRNDLDPGDWLIVKTSEQLIEIVHRHSRQIRRISNA